MQNILLCLCKITHVFNKGIVAIFKGGKKKDFKRLFLILLHTSWRILVSGLAQPQNKYTTVTRTTSSLSQRQHHN